MFVAATLAILLTMAMAITRVCLGPTVYDRILAVNVFGTKTVLLIAVLGYLSGRPEFLDIALVYALINFIGTIASSSFCATAASATPTRSMRTRGRLTRRSADGIGE